MSLSSTPVTLAAHGKQPRVTTPSARRLRRAPMRGTRTIAELDGSCLAEFAFAPQTADSDGDFVQGILTRDQYEVIES
jgi:hypothetical protein